MSDFPAKDAAINEYKNIFTNKTDYERKALRLMQESTGIVLQRLKSNIDVAVAERSAPVIEKFVNNLSSSLVGLTNSWIDSQKKQLMVVPEGTKFVSRDGDTVNMIVEQKPTVRTIDFKGNRYRIALPFVQFIISFKHDDRGNDRLHEIKATCTKKPISSLDEDVYFIPLPNTGYSRICVGEMLDENFININSGTNLCQKVDAIISQYWGSNFNDDLCEYFHQFLMFAFPQEYRKIRDQIVGVGDVWHTMLLQWVAASAKNPFFFNDVPSNCFVPRRLGDFLSTSYTGSSGNDVLVKNINAFVSYESRTLANSITASLSAVDLNEENRLQPHKVTLAKEIQSFCVMTLDSMWKTVHDEHEKKVENDNRELTERRRELENNVRNHEHILNSIKSSREEFDNERNSICLELKDIYNHLVSELEKVAELKAKLSGIVDDEGNIIKKRGKAKREPYPADVTASIDRASGSLSSYVGGIIQRPRRGRPRKVS